MSYTWLVTIAISHSVASAQCSISKVNENDAIVYIANYEHIHRNQDLENGIQGASFRLVALQNKEDMNLLKFGCYVMVNTSRPKEPIVPRKISITFQDNSKLVINADTYKPLSLKSGITSNECYFAFNYSTFEKFLNKKVIRVHIEDNRKNLSINSQPNYAIIQEQARCIAKEIE